MWIHTDPTTGLVKDFEVHIPKPQWWDDWGCT